MPGPIFIDLYEGAFGHTLRIAVPSRTELLKVRSIFGALARNAERVTSLENHDAFQMSPRSPLRSLNLLLVPTSSGKKLSCTSHGETMDIVWAMDKEEWATAVGLVDGLLRADLPGHQYLTREGVDDAVVELAYREGPEQMTLG
jgi:hypothetical protein